MEFCIGFCMGLYWIIVHQVSVTFYAESLNYLTFSFTKSFKTFNLRHVPPPSQEWGFHCFTYLYKFFTSVVFSGPGIYIPYILYARCYSYNKLMENPGTGGLIGPGTWSELLPVISRLSCTCLAQRGLMLKLMALMHETRGEQAKKVPAPVLWGSFFGLPSITYIFIFMGPKDPRLMSNLTTEDTCLLL